MQDRLKHSLLALLLTWRLAPAIAQEAPRAPRWTIALPQGIIAAQYQDEQTKVDDSFVYRRGYTGGLSLRYRVWRQFSWQTDLVYSHKGWNFAYFETVPCLECDRVLQLSANESVRVQQSNKYLDIPLLLRYDWGKRFRVFAQAGVYISFLLDESTAVQEVDIGVNFLPRPLLKSWDWGLSTGLGLHYAFRKNWGLEANATYQHGLLNINQGTFPYPIENPEQENLQNQTFGLRLGLTYTLSQMLK